MVCDVRRAQALLSKSGQVIVNADCSVPGHPEIFVIGDLARFVEDGNALPGVAQVPMQQGAYVAKLIPAFCTEEQRRAYLPRMATGELRATMALTEPGGVSDLQAMRTTARRDGESYVINGSKT